jgi:hypothetical protein
MGTRGRWGSTRGKGDAEAFEKVSERVRRLYIYISARARADRVERSGEEILHE